MNLKNKLINYLLKKTIRTDFTDMSDMERLRAYQRMDDPPIRRLLQARYTDSLIGVFLAVMKGNYKEADQLAGRMLELYDQLNSIENIEETLGNITAYLERQKRKRSAFQNFKQKLFKP